MEPLDHEARDVAEEIPRLIAFAGPTTSSTPPGETSERRPEQNGASRAGERDRPRFRTLAPVTTAQENLLSLSDYTFQRTRTRLEGLTDEEYLWEPVPDCWTIRPRPGGGYAADWAVPLTGTGPFTTIAWRLWHLINCYGAQRNATWLGLRSRSGEDIPAPGVTSDAAFAELEAPATATAARTALDAAHDFWRGCLLEVTEEGLSEKLGAVAGEYADSDRAGFVLHMLDEFIHHGAEIALLRDLYRAQREAQGRDPLVRALFAGDRDAVAAAQQRDPSALDEARQQHPDLVVEAASSGRWDAVAVLLDFGFAADVDEGAGPLHHAAGAGRLEVVRLLVEHGADINRSDPNWGATPKGWAEYFGHRDVVEYLAGLAMASGGGRSVSG